MDINKVEKILKALANRRRLKILKYLQKNKKASVTELAGHLKLSIKSTSRHLTVLKSADIAESEQVGLVNFYSLIIPPNEIIKRLISIL